MLIGEYTHTFDTKNRVALPAKFRKEFGKKVIVTKGLDRCLFIYTHKAWEKIVARMSDLSIGQAGTRGFNRFMLSGAVEVEPDSQGRILIPDFLKGFANLGGKVVLAGVNDRVEVWNESEWETYKSNIEQNADQLAEKLGEIGIL
ncbi:division/cell wall cluster transcriptional repressor MraZ [Candidatus Wolfebacteria bacterium]|nr:division/cell wall cluster transcriptional repressor MraZ [Candidatus Wolfebacteria bacterium]